MAYMTGYDEPYLGFSLPGTLTSAAGTVQSVANPLNILTGAVSSLFGSNPKDAGRLRSNSEAYSDAVVGDRSALTYLKARSLQTGTIPVEPPWHGDPISPAGGWATNTAKADAAAKYQQASTQNLASSLPASIAGSTVAGLATGPLLFVGAAMIGVYLLSQQKRRRRTA